MAEKEKSFTKKEKGKIAAFVAGFLAGQKSKEKKESLIVSSPKVDTRPDRYCSICKGSVKVPCVTEAEGRRRKCIR